MDIPKHVIPFAEEQGIRPDLMDLARRRMAHYMRAHTLIDVFVTDVFERLNTVLGNGASLSALQLPEARFHCRRQLRSIADSVGREQSESVVSLALSDCAADIAQKVWCAVREVCTEEDFSALLADPSQREWVETELNTIWKRTSAELGVPFTYDPGLAY